MTEGCADNGRFTAAVEKGEWLKVLVVDPRRVFAECLSHCLNQFPGIETISVARAKDWPKHPDDHPVSPDVILLCVAEGGSPAATISEVATAAEELRTLPVVLLSNERSPGQVLDLLKAGVRGFIFTDSGCAVAVQVLRLVRAGGTFVPANCLSSHFDEGTVGAERSELFTGRQKQVIEAIRLGKPNKIIAYELNMCESTVKVHVRAIMKKLKANNRTQVAHLYSATLGNTTNVDHERYLQVPEANNLTGTS
jgi:DNA-binding NarL/FixJ family response regulator